MTQPIHSRFAIMALWWGTLLAACGSGPTTAQPTSAPPTVLPPTVIATPAPTQPPSSQFDATLTPELIATPARSGTPALIMAGGLHVRSGPGPEFEVVVSLVRCTLVYVLAEEGGWVRIEQGYVHGDYITYDMAYPCADYTPQP